MIDISSLFNLVFHDIGEYTPKADSNPDELDMSFDVIDEENVYGDYEDLGNERLKEMEKLEAQEKLKIDLTNDQAVIDKLVEVFVLD